MLPVVWNRVRSSTPSARRQSPRIRVETLEDRSLPAFFAAPSFPAGMLGGAGSEPIAVAVGDFNRDGRLDAATANKGTHDVSVLLGNGNGTFKASMNFPIGGEPSCLLAWDLNKDGKLDLVTANKASNTVTVLLGNGLGGFKPAVHYVVGTAPVSVAAGDLNGDGFFDLATANLDGSSVTILYGNGFGKFPTSGTVAVGAQPDSVAIADFNQDNKLDLAVVSTTGFGALEVKLNAGGGTFSPAGSYDVGSFPGAVVVGRFNNDAFPDLAISCPFPSNDGVGVLLGQGNGSFLPATNYDAGSQSPLTLAVTDFNGDGFQDLVTVNAVPDDQFAGNSVSVLMANGTGGFGPARTYIAGQAPQGVATGDFNGDGVPDVVTADHGSAVGLNDPKGTVSLLLGNLDGTLAAAPNLVVNEPGPIAAGDLTGDGIPDLAVVTGSVNFNGVTVFPGLGDGSFGSRLLTPAIFNPTALAIADFNGDGKRDLAVTTGGPGGNLVDILLGNGNGTFGTPTPYTVGSNPQWVIADDFNNDTKPDLAVANGVGVIILLNNGTGAFGTPITLAAAGPATYLASADFNGDQKNDLAVVNESMGIHTVSVVLGNGNGTFGSPTSYDPGTGLGSVGAGLFNADTKADLAVSTFISNGGGSTVSILQYGSNGVLSLRAEYGTHSLPIGIAVADITGDGKADLAIANEFADDVLVYPGTGLGTFGAPTSYVVGDRPDWLAAADLNGDSRPDLAVVNGNSNTVTLLETPAGVASSFRVNVVPATATAGVAFKVTVAALDGLGHVIPGYRGAVSMSSSDATATLPATYQFTATDVGSHTFSVTLRDAGMQNIIAQSGAATGSDSVVVSATVANHLNATALPNLTAGMPFDLIVTALDRFGNIAPGYRGTVHLSTNDNGLGVTLAPNYTFTAGDAGVHFFTGGVTLVTSGAHTVSAKALGTLWPRASATVDVQADAAAHLTISAPISPVAGASAPVTVTARDQWGNIATGFTGTVQFSSTDGSALLPADYTFTPGDQGVHTFQIAFATAGTQSLTVTAPSLTDGQQSGILVKPGIAAQLNFVQQPQNAFIATPEKSPVTVRVADAFGNFVGAGVKVTLALSNNPGGAILSGASVLTGANGIATFKALTLSKKGQGYTLVAHAGTGTSLSSSAFTVYGVTHFGLNLSSTQTVAGTSLTATVVALDSSNQPDPSYAGTVRFHSTDSLADLPTDYTFQPGDNGQHTFSVTLKSAGLQTVTVADTVKTTIVKTASATVSAAAVSGFLVTGYPLTTVHNVSHTFTVSVVDAYGNRVTNYKGPMVFSNSGGAALLPDPYTFTAADAGRHSFTATFQTVGSGQSLTVTDQINPLITGTLSGINVT